MAPRGSFRIGTSGWHYPHWKGPFYPDKIKSGEMLEFYADRFDTVEINNSFYHLPREETLKSWRDQVPPEFIFAVKGSRYITHMKKLREPGETTAKFFERIAILGRKLGPVLFQLPPHWNLNPSRLEAFLKALPGNLRYAMEFRDTTWFDPRVYRLLEGYGVAFCIYELAGLLSPRRVTADFVYVRLHGPTRKKYEGAYGTQRLSGWAGAFSTWARQGRDVYCYFDNDQAGYAAADAAHLNSMLTGR
jgi:uncharacterized protein YecE (DUF72 family)